jgi:hypothetical protein
MAVLAALEVALAVISERVLPLLAALFILAILGFYLYTTLRGKFVVWAELLDQLNLRGGESWTWDVAGVRYCSWPPNT